MSSEVTDLQICGSGCAPTVATLRPRVHRETGDSPDRNDSGPFPACSTPSMPLVSPRRTF